MANEKEKEVLEMKSPVRKSREKAEKRIKKLKGADKRPCDGEKCVKLECFQGGSP